MGVFIRTVRTKSGATAVQIVEKRGPKIVNVEHFGSAHTPEQLALLRATAEESLRPGQQAFDLALPATTRQTLTPAAHEPTQPALTSPLEPELTAPVAPRPEHTPLGTGQATVTGTFSQILWNTLSTLYDAAGFNTLDDQTFKKLVVKPRVW